MTDTQAGAVPTQGAVEFMQANSLSPVVWGGVNVAWGVVMYQLENGTAWQLTSEDERSMPAPRWKRDEVKHD